MAPRTLPDDGSSPPPYGSTRTSARTRQLRQLYFRQAPALLRWSRHHTNRVPKPLRLSRRRVLRALALLRYTPHCTPGSSPYAYKRKNQGPLTEGWPRGDEDETGARVRPLAPSPAWTLVTPYCKRTRPGRGTNTKAARFPPLSRPTPATSLPPFALGLAPTHLGWGTRRHSLVGPGTPRSRNADRWEYQKLHNQFFTKMDIAHKCCVPIPINKMVRLNATTIILLKPVSLS
jgi:hypothetical protein